MSAHLKTEFLVLFTSRIKVTSVLPTFRVLQELTLPGGRLALLCFRTVYHVGYRLVYTVKYQTTYRCCPGWSQRAGDAGCLYRKYRAVRCRSSFGALGLFFWLRELISGPLPAVNTIKLPLERTGDFCCLLLGFFIYMYVYLFTATVCPKDPSLAPSQPKGERVGPGLLDPAGAVAARASQRRRAERLGWKPRTGALVLLLLALLPSLLCPAPSCVFTSARESGEGCANISAQDDLMLWLQEAEAALSPRAPYSHLPSSLRCLTWEADAAAPGPFPKALRPHPAGEILKLCF